MAATDAINATGKKGAVVALSALAERLDSGDAFATYAALTMLGSLVFNCEPVRRRVGKARGWTDTLVTLAKTTTVLEVRTKVCELMAEWAREYGSQYGAFIEGLSTLVSLGYTGGPGVASSGRDGGVSGTSHSPVPGSGSAPSRGGSDGSGRAAGRVPVSAVPAPSPTAKPRQQPGQALPDVPTQIAHLRGYLDRVQEALFSHAPGQVAVSQEQHRVAGKLVQHTQRLLATAQVTEGQVTGTY